jgi:hypothetical protein
MDIAQTARHLPGRLPIEIAARHLPGRLPIEIAARHLPGRLPMEIAVLLPGRFAAAIGFPGYYHEEKAT